MDNTAELRESREQLTASQDQTSRLEAELSQARVTEAGLKRQLAEVEREAKEKLNQMEEVSHYACLLSSASTCIREYVYKAI